MSFLGTWKCSVDPPLGRHDLTLCIRDDNGIIVGQAIGKEVAPLHELSLEDGRIRWTQTITKPVSMTITFEVIQKGNVFRGVARPTFLPPVKVVGRRLPAI